MPSRRNAKNRSASSSVSLPGRSQVYAQFAADSASSVAVLRDDAQVRAQSKADLLGWRQLVLNRIQRGMEGGCSFARDLPEQVGLRVDVGVERALLDAHRLGQVADRGAVVALLREETRGLARQLVSAGAHVGYPNGR